MVVSPFSPTDGFMVVSRCWFVFYGVSGGFVGGGVSGGGSRGGGATLVVSPFFSDRWFRGGFAVLVCVLWCFRWFCGWWR